ncbi:hypothetical protein F4776DRAFT_320995 [Hypoxylon sp. NC0597]|nr:hypothetical protein F4776DRAFT_320995 [Hypoxylon sp. NC0597]
MKPTMLVFPNGRRRGIIKHSMPLISTLLFSLGLTIEPPNRIYEIWEINVFPRKGKFNASSYVSAQIYYKLKHYSALEALIRSLGYIDPNFYCHFGLTPFEPSIQMPQIYDALKLEPRPDGALAPFCQLDSSFYLLLQLRGQPDAQATCESVYRKRKENVTCVTPSMGLEFTKYTITVQKLIS